MVISLISQIKEPVFVGFLQSNDKMYNNVPFGLFQALKTPLNASIRLVSSKSPKPIQSPEECHSGKYPSKNKVEVRE